MIIQMDTREKQGKKDHILKYLARHEIEVEKIKLDVGDYKIKGKDNVVIDLKQNILDFSNNDYTNSLKLLEQINMYKYEYKYNLSEHQDQYGFLIDELEEQEQKLNTQFFHITKEEASIDDQGKIHLNPDEMKQEDEFIEVARYNQEIFSKYLLIVCKALQQKIQQLEKEIKEIRHNEI